MGVVVLAGGRKCKIYIHIIIVMQYDAAMRSLSEATKTASKASKASAPRITITLPPEHYKHILQLAMNKRVSASWIVRDAVAKYLDEDMPLFAENRRPSL